MLVIKIVKTIGPIFIPLQILLGQPEFTPSSTKEIFDPTPKDSIAFLNLPARPVRDFGGSEFADQMTGLSVTDREEAVVKEILSGNVPSFSRTLKPLKINRTINGKIFQLIIFVTCDYMAIGSDMDYLYIPMTPSTAQYLADKLDCILPTKKMVDIIYSKAGIKLRPQPIPPSDKMTTVPVFEQHTDSVSQQLNERSIICSSDPVIAGHKKDIIISKKIYSADRDFSRVVIYGWHSGENQPIQPVYDGHDAKYADYSHGVRLISRTALINGEPMKIEDILSDERLCVLLSDEGVISKPYYPKR